jgi:hypothetical protein
MYRRALPLLLLLLACHAQDGESAPTRGWSYTVRFEPGLERAHVRLCFDGYVPKRLVLSRLEALPAIRIRAGERGQPHIRPNPARDGLLPAGLERGGCLEYDVDLKKLASIFRLTREAWTVGRDYLVRTGLLLLHPARWPEDAEVTLDLQLPEGYRAAVPWPEKDGRYRLSKWSTILNSRFAIGRWKPQLVEANGGRLHVALLDGPQRITNAGIERWLQVASRAVSDLYGRFPVRELPIIVHPIVPGRPRPIISGRTCMAGGPHVHVMLSGDTTDARMPGEHLTIHEFVHLGLPWTELADRWFQEGFASYYQTVLRARAGILTEREGWQRLHAYFEQGRRSGGKRTLAEEALLMTPRYAYHRVYWGGAALALLMDMEIRRRWPGKRTLDDAVRFLHQNHLIEGKTYTGLEVMDLMDGYLGQPVCAPIARRYLASRAFPDLSRAYAALGLRWRGGALVYSEGAPQARDRGIMRPKGR